MSILQFYKFNFFTFLLHGSGINKYDELIIFIGFMLVVITLGILSWRIGKKKDNYRKQKKKNK